MTPTARREPRAWLECPDGHRWRSVVRRVSVAVGPFNKAQHLVPDRATCPTCSLPNAIIHNPERAVGGGAR